VIRVMNFGSSKAEMTQDVLRNPERYIAAINSVLLLFCGFCILIAGCVTLEVTGSLFAALLIEVTPFVSGTTLTGLIWHGRTIDDRGGNVGWGRSRADSEVESREHPRWFAIAFGIACRDRDSSQDRFCAGGPGAPDNSAIVEEPPLVSRSRLRRVFSSQSFRFSHHRWCAR